MQKYFGMKMIFNKYSGPKYLYVALSILFGNQLHLYNDFGV